MKLLSTTVICMLLIVMSTAAQEPNAENFFRLRAQIIERLTRSSERLGRTLDGNPVAANVSQVFGIPSETRVIKAAEMVFPEQHHLTLTFAINSTDILLTETKKTSDGTLLLTVFHTDPTLALRGAASGPDTGRLHVVTNDSDAISAFREVLLTWDRQLLRSLEPRTSPPVLRPSIERQSLPTVPLIRRPSIERHLNRD
jgi:hypothetical protein